MPVVAHRSVVCDERDSIGSDSNANANRIRRQLMDNTLLQLAGTILVAREAGFRAVVLMCDWFGETLASAVDPGRNAQKNYCGTWRWWQFGN
jgi:hypothetical protein